MHAYWRPLLRFYGLTFVITHALTTAYRLAGGSWQSLDSFVVANGIMLIPGLTALIFVRFGGGGATAEGHTRAHPHARESTASTLGLRPRPNRWWLVAWLLPPVLMLMTLGTSLLIPGTSYDPGMSGLGERMGYPTAEAARLRGQMQILGLPPLAAFVVQGMLVGPTLGLIAALGEEVAWRGLLHRWLIPLGFWRCSLITGVLWGLWHVPLTLQGYGYPRHPKTGTAVFLIYVLLFAPLLTFVRARARSVFAPAILHGTANGTVLLTLALVRGGDDLTTGWGSLACVAVLGIANVGLAVARPSVPLRD